MGTLKLVLVYIMYKTDDLTEEEISCKNMDSMVKYWSHTRIESSREIDPDNLLIRKPILMVTKNILQIVIAVIISTRGLWVFGVCGFGCKKKNSVFRLWCFSWFADFPFFSVWFSLFVKNTIGTSDSVCERVPVSLRSEQQFCASTDLE